MNNTLAASASPFLPTAWSAGEHVPAEPGWRFRARGGCCSVRGGSTRRRGVCGAKIRKADRRAMAGYQRVYNGHRWFSTLTLLGYGAFEERDRPCTGPAFVFVQAAMPELL